jgi:hypothetical protein
METLQIVFMILDVCVCVCVCVCVLVHVHVKVIEKSMVDQSKVSMFKYSLRRK